MSAREFSVVGQAVPRVDAEEKMSGRAKYTTDLALPGMAYAKLALSPLPHARIVSIDASRARALPGVYAVLTAAELTGMETHYGSDRKDRPHRGDEQGALRGRTHRGGGRRRSGDG